VGSGLSPRDEAGPDEGIEVFADGVGVQSGAGGKRREVDWLGSPTEEFERLVR